MKIFDTETKGKGSHAGKRTAILHQANNFRIRIIDLPPGEQIPSCEMASSVIFYVLSGSADVTVDDQTASVRNGRGIVSGPATVSMKTANGARLIGIQIDKKE